MIQHMIPIEKLIAVQVIVTHENCPDGIVAAMFLHDALPDAEIRFLHSGSPAHEALNPEPGMLFCDLPPSPNRYQEFVAAGAIVLDHHKSAASIVAAFGALGVFGDEVTNPGVCGAYLAYREVWLRLRHNPDKYECTFAEEIARLSGIRDTWLRSAPEWDEACALAEALRFYPVESWLEVTRPFRDHQSWWHERRATGALLITKTAESVQRAIKGAFQFVTEHNTRVCLFPNTSLSSDTAEALGDTADLVVGFGYIGVEEGFVPLIFSTRSHTNFKCVDFCKFFSGGGHTKAAGFTVNFRPNPADPNPLSGCRDPYSTLIRLLRKYENGDMEKFAVLARKDGTYDLLAWPSYDQEPTISCGGMLDLESARLMVPRNLVKIGIDCLGKDESGNPKYPEAIEVWV